MSEGLRLRVEFDRDILSKSQRSEGLRRSWVHLKPHLHRTISDVAAHLLHLFHLHDSCPNGLLIYMDHFVLPPFESTSIFKDTDIVCVMRKGYVGMIDNGTNNIEVQNIVERLPVNPGMKLLANAEFEEAGGYKSESEQDEPDQLEDILPDTDANTHSKKRKRTNKPESSKRKKSKFATNGECSNFPKETQDDGQEEKNKSPSKHRSKKRLSKKDKSFTGESELDDKITSEADKRTNDTSKSTPSAKRSCELQENEMKGVVSSGMPNGSEKLPSRSARRKKAKRKWLRENMKEEKEALHQVKVGKSDTQKSSDKDIQQSSAKADKKSSDEANQKSSDKAQHISNKDNENSSEKRPQPNTDNDEEENIVPVVIRPGHIRFTPLGEVDADQSFQQNEMAKENFPWNGITSKKKGQKWGQEKTSYSKKSDHYDLYNESSEIVEKSQKWGQEKTSYSKKSDYYDLYNESSEIVEMEKEIPVNNPLDFDKLELCTTLPKEGDQIAYRLIELSSCWTPEVSSYRVGEVSEYSPESNKIVLIQVPEYPIVFGETDEASEIQPDTSLYREDGSLEIDYSSLLDVRIVKYGNLDTAKVVTGNQPAAKKLRFENSAEAWTTTGIRFKNTQAATSGFRLMNDKETKASASDPRFKNDTETQAPASGYNDEETQTPASGFNDKETQAPVSGFNDKETHVNAQENGKVRATDDIWQALDAKKAELSQKNVWADCSGRSACSSRPWRGSALAPTIALLRAQSEL